MSLYYIILCYMLGAENLLPCNQVYDVRVVCPSNDCGVACMHQICHSALHGVKLVNLSCLYIYKVSLLVLQDNRANTSCYHIKIHTHTHNTSITEITPYTMQYRCIVIHTFVHALWLFRSPFIHSIQIHVGSESSLNAVKVTLKLSSATHNASELTQSVTVHHTGELAFLVYQ